MYGYGFLRRSFTAVYIAAATDSKENRTVKTGKLSLSQWSSLNPPKIPMPIMANI